jgi:large subunit ribosomal protein L35
LRFAVIAAEFLEDGMGYKFKPSKAVAKRFKVTKTGKLKRHHSFTSHLMSARPANKRRKLRRSAILFEGHARNMRQLMGISHLNPARVEHERALEEKAGGAEGAKASAPVEKSTKRTATRAPAKEANPTKKASSRNTRSSK